MRSTRRILHRRWLSAGALLLMPIAALGQGPLPPAAPRPETQKNGREDATLTDAHDLLMTGQYEPAMEIYERLRDDSRYRIDAGVGLARCRLRIGKYEDAVAGLIELNATGSAAWHYALARLIRRTGQYEQVLRHGREASRIAKDHTGARLLVADTLMMLGRRDEAIAAYQWFDRQLVGRAELPRDPEWITNCAVGCLRYSVLTDTNVTSRTQHVLHEMLQMAYGRLDRSYWPARIAAADLLREKFNNDEDDGSVSDYEAALRINPHLPEAHVGLGEVVLENWNFEEVERRAQLALDVDPLFAPAIHLLAKKSILERRYAQAIEQCARALAINPHDLTALSLSAAASACRYDSAAVDRMRDRIKAINPRPAVLHRAMGDALAGLRQYRASEEQYLKSIQMDPNDANTRTILGMMYMQWGLEGKARDALEASWALDPFNTRTKFTLDLLDSLEKFDRHETEHFIVRYDSREDPGLGAYVASYLEEIYSQVTDDFDTTLEHKTIIELFPTLRAFGVRITGKPWIHTVGACTGRVIALASPRRSPKLMGPFNFARVLKHEFTHTVTLAATHNRIPHWLTEGLAVYQEDAPRSFEWWELLADASRRGQLFTLESINWGFIRPRRPNDRQLAYAQSEWMCEYIVERFGYDIISTMLDRFRQGSTQQQVFTNDLSVEPSGFDHAFQAWAKARLAKLGFDTAPVEDVTELRTLVESAETDAGLISRLARAEFDDGAYDRALAAARRALELEENQPIALKVLVKVLALMADQEKSESAKLAHEREALPALERLLTVDPDGWTAPKLLATIALRREDWDRAVESFKRLQRLCPMDSASHRALAGIYLQRGEDDLATSQLLELVRVEQQDSDIAAKLASIYKRKGRLRDAQYWYRQALYIDPFNVSHHHALADTSMMIGDTQAALREYRMLMALEPANPRHVESAAMAAHKLGDKEEALHLARRAVELDPASPVRSLLPKSPAATIDGNP